MSDTEGENWADAEGRHEQLWEADEFYAQSGILGAKRLGLSEDQAHEYDPTTGQWS
jgi:hypothetical protein